MSSNNKNIRIKTNPSGDTQNDKYINVNIEQDFNNLEILSLKISQKDLYQDFSASYGCLVGRIQSKGVGLPNVKVGIFIPVDDLDLNDEDILSVYPYESVYQVDNTGKKFNLLNALRRLNPFSGYIENDYGVGYTPKTPVGSIPDKVELVTNPTWLYVYKKYLKFTTVTNSAGDFMLMGVPVGEHTLHVDCDITDVGRFSTPAPIIKKLNNLSDNLFSKDGTQIKKQDDLSKLPNIQSKNIGVTIKPMWEQNDNVVTITRQDVDLNVDLYPSFTIFGNGITMAKNAWWFDRIIFRMFIGLKNLCVDIGSNGFDNCKNAVRSCNKFICVKMDIGLCIKLKLCVTVLGKDFKWTLFSYDSGNVCSSSGSCKSEFKIKICMSFKLKNSIPIMKLETFLSSLAETYFCRLNGGKYDANPVDIISLGKTNKCTVEDAFESTPVDGLTVSLDLNQHRSMTNDIRILALNEDESTNVNDYNDVNDVSNAFTLLNNEDYYQYNKDGQFVIVVPCNRNRVITDEIGNLIPIDDPSKGVYSEFRGYMLISMNGDIQNPPTKERTGRINLKIPQNIKYRTDSKKWVFEHFKFELGKLYSVAQLFNTRNYNKKINNTTKDYETSDGGTGKVFQSGLTNQKDEGWDRQTGLILNVDDDISNHITYLSNVNTSDGVDVDISDYAYTPKNGTIEELNNGNQDENDIEDGTDSDYGKPYDSVNGEDVGFSVRFNSINNTLGIIERDAPPSIDKKSPVISPNWFSSDTGIYRFTFNTFVTGDDIVSYQLFVGYNRHYNFNTPNTSNNQTDNQNLLMYGSNVRVVDANEKSVGGAFIGVNSSINLIKESIGSGVLLGQIYYQYPVYLKFELTFSNGTKGNIYYW